MLGQVEAGGVEPLRHVAGDIDAQEEEGNAAIAVAAHRGDAVAGLLERAAETTGDEALAETAQSLEAEIEVLDMGDQDADS